MHSLSWVHALSAGVEGSFPCVTCSLIISSFTCWGISIFVCLSLQVILQFSPFSYGLVSSYIEGLLEFLTQFLSVSVTELYENHPKLGTKASEYHFCCLLQTEQVISIT